MKSLLRVLCLLALLPVSCADKKTSPPEHKTLSQRLDQKNGYKQDDHGNWVPQVDQRSQYESKGKSPYFQGNYDKKTYQTGNYDKKSWWGNKDFGSKQYANNTDGSRFQKNSQFSQQSARESGSPANLTGAYQTGAYATGPAREAGHQGILRKSDSATESRRNAYPQPEVIDWQEQRNLSVEQSKGILGH